MKVKASVPATLANMGSGFDTLGIAVELRNTVVIEESKTFSVIETGSGIAGEDLVLKTIVDFFEKKKLSTNFKITKNTKIPAGKGLGSSAAAVVSGLGAAMKFIDEFDREELFKTAAAIEGHPDNVAAAVYGGLAVSAGLSNRFVAMKVQVPFKVLTVLIPPFCTFTEKARGILPKEISLSDAVFNLQRSALLLAGFSNGIVVGEGFEDRIHQSARLSIYPELNNLFEGIKRAANGPVFLCGSGPSVAIVGSFSGDLPEGWERMTLDVSEEGIRLEF